MDMHNYQPLVASLAHETDLLLQLHLQLLVLPGQLYPQGCLHTPHQGLRWRGREGGEGGEGEGEGERERMQVMQVIKCNINI